MQAQLKEEMKAALEAEEQPLQPESPGGGGGGEAPKTSGEVQARLEQLEGLAAERLAELEAAEEEKYMMSSDLEVLQKRTPTLTLTKPNTNPNPTPNQVLQEELEDANAHQKRYYEALMSKEQQLREMRGSCAALQTAVPCSLVITPHAAPRYRPRYRAP